MASFPNADFLAELGAAMKNLDRAANDLLAASLLAPDAWATAKTEELRREVEAIREKVRMIHRIY